MTIKQKTAFGTATGGGLVYLAVGIAALIISLRYKDVSCGAGDASFNLTLQQWVFGTGIAYIIIGACFSVFAGIMICTVIGIIPLILVWLFSGIFVLAWAIVGGISVWKYGGDCESGAYALWAMGMAAEIITLIMIFFTCCSSKFSHSES